MNITEIHDSLDAMLANPKSKNFLNHIVRSYFPLTNVEKVWEKPVGPFKCLVTGVPLISIEEVLVGIQSEDYKMKFINNLKASLKEDGTISTAPMSEILEGRVLGLRGKDTTTFMSYEGLQEFHNWLVTKLFKGDKHISWLLGSVGKKTLVKRAENIQDEEVQRKVVLIKKQEPKGAFSLGELDSFKALREKFTD